MVAPKGPQKATTTAAYSRSLTGGQITPTPQELERGWFRGRRCARFEFRHPGGVRRGGTPAREKETTIV
jgi:hypothetical protein